MVIFMASSKVKMINVRLTSEIHNAFKIACALRGVSMSSFLHQTVVRTIREEKEREPRAFQKPSLEKDTDTAIAVQNLGELTNESKTKQRRRSRSAG